MNMAFKFTARDIPQQNHKAEVSFATLANKGRALLHCANILSKLRYKLYPKAFQMATALDNLAAVTIKGKTKTRYEYWYSKLPNFVNHMQTFGEARTVRLKIKKTPKIAD